MIPGNINTDLISGDEGGYQISRSLRFNSADSAYLSRTPASAGNRKTWTWSGWVKKVKNESILPLLNARQSSSDFLNIWFDSGDGLFVRSRVGGSDSFYAYTAAVFRDPSAWYHVLIAVDTIQASGSNGVKVYVNGTQQTLTIPTYNQNADTYVNSTFEHRIGYLINQNSSTYYLDSYLADLHLIDGQQLTPSSFTEVSATTGQLIPKAYTGSYGTNGFRLDFSDNSAATATTLGKDYSGNSNNWTPNNLSVTAGAGNDSLVDTPTSYGTDTGVGGEVRGNYCTWNPIRNVIYPATTANGNLELSVASGYLTGAGSISVSTGKWYWEMTLLQRDTATPNYQWAGVVRSDDYSAAAERIFTGASSAGVQYWGDTGKLNNTETYGATFTTNDVIGVAFDVGAGSITFYKNGVSQGASTFNLVAGAGYYPSAGGGGNFKWAANFGQRPFVYTAPSGFKALCDTNLPAPVVAKSNSVFDVALWTGNGSARSITGLNFNPDFVWIKGRSGATDHALYDAVRGATIDLVSNSTAAETTQTQGLTAFNSDGFSLGTLAKVNTNTATYAGWAWDAGSSTVTNTQGSITSQVRANASAGFSIVTYTGTGAAATIGHGLNAAPGLIICKMRSSTQDWLVYHSALGSSQYIWLNLTSAAASGTIVWGGTNPTSGVFSVGSANGVNQNTQTYVAYCFAPVAGYSAFGSYTGNGSTDGPFVYTGFRPRWILIKRTDSSGNNWVLHDTARDTYNAATKQLLPSTADAETDTSVTSRDILSNGFKLRGDNAAVNGSSATYIYAAFAENPFQYARAR